MYKICFHNQAVCQVSPLKERNSYKYIWDLLKCQSGHLHVIPNLQAKYPEASFSGFPESLYLFCTGYTYLSNYFAVNTYKFQDTSSDDRQTNMLKTNKALKCLEVGVIKQKKGISRDVLHYYLVDNMPIQYDFSFYDSINGSFQIMEGSMFTCL